MVKHKYPPVIQIGCSLVFLILLAGGVPLRAKSLQVAGELRHGDRTLSGRADPTTTGFKVEVDSVTASLEGVTKTDDSFTIVLRRAVSQGQTVTITLEGGDSDGESETLVVRPAYVDGRDTMVARVFLGTMVDTFAAENAQKLFNPEASGGVETRGVAGFEFSFRLAGSPQEEDGRNTAASQGLWVYGETMHGARSSSFDCADPKNATFPTCQDLANNPPPDPSQTFGLLRNAGTLEGIVGFRHEFLSIQRTTDHPASLYWKGQAGFVTVSDGPDDAAGVHHVGLGMVVTRGRFQDSYLEAGYGINELFQDKPKKRWKIEAMLTMPVSETVSFSVQFLSDTDIGDGPDSFQTYFGFDFDMVELIKKFQ